MTEIWDNFTKARGANGIVLVLRQRGSYFEKWDAELNDWLPIGWSSDNEFGGGATRIASWSERRGVTEQILKAQATA
tara:strand:+ start:427 stop:657 length:231 start_codon:yes stop_codon:yes gene_type:complete